jgi:hypothetical protein
MAAEALAAIRSASPTARVAVGALDRFEWGYLDPLLSSGAAQGADALSVHPYRTEAPESFLEELRVLRGALGARLPLAGLEAWASEWGWSSSGLPNAQGLTGHGDDPVARRRQAVLVARTALSTWASGLPLSVLYDVSDDCADPANPECNFGLLDSALAPKPAYQALSTLGAQAAGKSLSSLPWTPAPWVHAVEMRGAAQRVVAVWVSRERGCTQVHLPPGSTVVDLLGTPRSLQPLPGAVALSTPLCEADGPVYAQVP